ncbi:mitochondrial mRNA pseudouridine synthase Rpusd3-like [Oratosquilla oratoria]|uniref:mitochondrial mRNA pseudouridine synthase Rpusd3-like n=1 Tax=Oratosquilla oratoria TaxID=337810 RepID=UPI003F757644
MEMKLWVLSSFRKHCCLPCASLRHLSIAVKAKRYTKQKSKKKKETQEVLSSHEEKRIRKKLLTETEKKHTFRQLYPWKTKLEFAQHLKQSQTYYQDGLLAVNKPYGIPILGHLTDLETRQNIIQTLSSGVTPEGIPSLQDALPLLKDLYDVPHMEIIKAPERWTSGVTLLGTQPETKAKVQKSLRRSLAAQIPPLTYWAIVLGKTNPETYTGKVGMALEDVKEKGKVPVITLKYTKTAVKEALVKVNCVHHKVLVNNSETMSSLVEVKVQNKRWHFLRVWCAYNYSPILGDMLYGGRVRRVGGNPVLISPHNMTAYSPPKIFPSTLSRLGLSENTQELIPCHLHLYNICLEQYGTKKTSLNITAQPPQHFIWSCFQLGLMAEPIEEDVKEEVEMM